MKISPQKTDKLFQNIATGKLEKEAESSMKGLQINPGQPLADTFTGKSLLPVLVKKPKHSFFIKMTEEENATLPAELRNTELGKKFAETASEIRHKNFEVVTYNIHQNGNEIARSCTNDALECDISNKDKNKIERYINSKIELASIHNHPYKSTFSIFDLIYSPDKSTIATMPDGGYAFWQKQENSLPIADRLINAYINLNEDLILKLIKMKTDNNDITKIIDKVGHKNLKEIADRHNIRYEYKKGTLDKKNVIDIDYTKVIENYFRQTFGEDNYKTRLEEAYKEIDNYSLSNIMKRNIFFND